MSATKPIKGEQELRRLLRQANFERPIEWDGKILDGDDLPFIPQSSSLGDTLIQLGDTYEESREHCAAIESAVNMAPRLLAEVSRLRRLLAGSPRRQVRV